MKTHKIAAAILLAFITQFSPAQNNKGWFVVNSNLPGNSHGIYFWHPDSGYAINYNNPEKHPVFYYTYDGGTRWDTLAYFDTISYIGPFFDTKPIQVFDKNTIYFLVRTNSSLNYRCYIYITYDAGKTWQTKNVGTNLFDFHFRDKARGLMYGLSGGFGGGTSVYATEDSLKTGKYVGSDIVEKRDVFFYNPLPTSGGTNPWYTPFYIYKGWDSLLAGVRTLLPAQSGYKIESFHRNDTTIFRPKNTSGYAASYDQGKTWVWVDVNSNSYKFLNTLLPSKFGQFYFAGKLAPISNRGYIPYGILDLEDYYYDYSDFPNDTGCGYLIVNDTVGYIFTITNRILKTTNAGNTLEIRKHIGVNPKTTAPENTRQVVLIPNPATNKVKVTLQTGEEISEINFYDTGGRFLLRQTLPEVDISTWPPGTYIVQVCTASHTYNSKLVKE